MGKDLSSIFGNSGQYPVAGGGGATYEGSPSLILDDSDGISSNEMINNNVLSNTGQFNTNGLSPDNGITSQLNVNQTLDVAEKFVDSQFIAELPNSANLENSFSFSNAPEMVHLDAHGMTEPRNIREKSRQSVQDLTNAVAQAGAAIVDQSGIQNAFGLQQPLPKNQTLQPAHVLLGTNDYQDSHCNCGKCCCLKLYCDCFRSGLFCGTSCSCVNCCNTKDYEDTVEVARERMISQNPNAFDSKLEIIDKRNGTTPIKHRRGCNCKKSKCAKRYCECYQADVGCHELCRCEGCKNPYNKNSDESNNMPNSNTVPSSEGVSQHNVS